MHQPARNMFSSFISFPRFPFSRRGLFSLRETARPSRYPASVQLRTRLFEPRVVLGLVSTVSAETRKGWNDEVAARSRSWSDIPMEEGGENLSKFFSLYIFIIFPFFWIFLPSSCITIKMIGALYLIIKYVTSIFIFDRWNCIALEICSFVIFIVYLLRVLNIFLFFCFLSFHEPLQTITNYQKRNRKLSPSNSIREGRLKRTC